MKEETISLVENHLLPVLQQAHSLVTAEYKTYLQCIHEALRRIYVFGIFNDLLKKFGEYRNEKNVILLADTPRLLSEVITGQDAPFIYEKVGNQYKHMLIDEFQDTSALQWKIFCHLLPIPLEAAIYGTGSRRRETINLSLARWKYAIAGEGYYFR